jgi:hypothetical protein
MGSSRIRDGKGHRAYRRKQAALKRRAQRENIPCSWCGEEILFDVPSTHPRSFTADHPVAIHNGGDLVKQELAVMCRACNARKGDHAVTEIWGAS